MGKLEFKVGALIAVALGVLATFIFILGNMSVGKGFRFYVDYNFSGNIQPGAPVKVSGIKVGKVDEVLFLGGKMDEKAGRRVQVRLKLWVEERAKETIRQDAEFFVNTAGVLGEQYLEISPGSYEKPALVADSVSIGVDPPRTDLVVARLYELLESVTGLLRDDKDLVRDLLHNSAVAIRELSTILSQNRDQIGSLIAETGKLASEGAGVLGKVREGLSDPKIVSRTLEDLDATLVSAGQALADLTPRVARLTDEGTRLTGYLTEKRAEEAFLALGTAQSLLGKTGHLVDNADALLADMRAGRGTAGQIIAREELYADIKELVRDLKRNPWKFLWKE